MTVEDIVELALRSTDFEQFKQRLHDYRRDKAHEPDEGESGQDRESYSDDQDRESYYVEPDEGEDDPRSGVDGWGQS